MDSDTLIVLVVLFIGLIAGFWLARKITAKEYSLKLDKWKRDSEKRIREDAIKGSRRTLGGKFSDKLAPFLPDFKYDPTEIRYLGDPIDLVVFKGHATRETEEIVFLEVKSGKKGLDKPQRRIRDVIENGKVRFEVYRVPEEITQE